MKQKKQKKQKIFFRDSQNNRICGILSRKKGDKKIVLLCHGFATSKNGASMTALEESLNKKNISTLKIDLYAHGESEGKRRRLDISHAVDSIDSAINYLKKLGYKKIALHGSSFSGPAAFFVASKRKDIVALTQNAPVSDYYTKLKNEKGPIRLFLWWLLRFDLRIEKNGLWLRPYSLFKESKNYLGHEAAKNIKIPVLIIHGDKDTRVPIKQSIKTLKNLKNGKIVVLKGCPHVISKTKYFQQSTEMLADFFVKQLK